MGGKIKADTLTKDFEAADLVGLVFNFGNFRGSFLLAGHVFSSARNRLRAALPDKLFDRATSRRRG